MSKKIIIVKTVEITLAAECDKLSDTQLINDIQGLYDNYGIDSTMTMGESQETESIHIESINGEMVFSDGGRLDYAGGGLVIIDGKKLWREDDE